MRVPSDKSPEPPIITDFNHALPLHIATLVDVCAGKAMPFTREQISAIGWYFEVGCDSEICAVACD